MTRASSALLALLLFGFEIAWGGAAVTYHGRILDSNGDAVQNAGVVFKIQVRSPGTPNCLLYEETRTVDMRNSDGVFVIPIGDGVGARSGSDPGILIENVFSNNAGVDHMGLACNSGGHYQPVPLDSRKLLVSFNDGTGSGDQALPAMDINYVPLALHSEEASSALKVGTVPASQVMSVASGAATPLSAANFAELLLLVNGNSNAYVKPSSIPTCASGEVLKGTSGAFVCVAAAGGTDTLAGISCPDGKVLKRVSGAWACGDDSGVASEADPTVKAYAKSDPGAGLKLVSSVVAVDFGSGAGKAVEGNDARLSDARAPNGAATGDLNGSYPNPTVKGIRGNSVAATTPQDGQFYKWINGSTEWQPKFISFGDLRKSDGTLQMPSTCAANEALAWSAVTDLFTCAAIGSLDASKITTGTLAYARLPVGTAVSTVAAGDDSRFPSSSCGPGNKMRWDGSAWQCEVDATGSSSVSCSATANIGNQWPVPGGSWTELGSESHGTLSSCQTLAGANGASAFYFTNSGNYPLCSYGYGTPAVYYSQYGGGCGTGTCWPNTSRYDCSSGYTPGPGLVLNGSNQLVPDFGAVANKVVQGNDSRLSDARAPSGPAGGELGGTYPNPTIAKLAGVSLSVSSLASGQVLKYDGSNWVNSAPSTTATDLSTIVGTGLVARTGVGAFSALGVSAPITNSGTNIGLAVGSGLTLNAGNLVPDFGTASGKIAQGNDSRFPSSTCASGNYNRWNGSAWVCDAAASTDSSKVAKNGDTMTGALNLPANGLVLGTDQLVASGGNVGIGTTSPGQKLTVNGTIESLTGGIKFPDGTIQTTSAVGGVNNTVITNWPDAITCNVTNPAWGLAVFRPFLMPYSVDGTYRYRLNGSSSNYDIIFNSDGTFNGYTNVTASDCNVSTSNLYANGKAFNFAKGPAAQWLAGTGSSAYYNAGRVGIGTATPLSPLSVVQPYTKTDTTERVVGAFTSNDASNPSGVFLNVKGGASSAARYANIQGSEYGLGAISLVLNGSGGNVGIGTVSPSVALDVAGAIRPGSSSAVTACGSGAANGEGSQRYNYTSHAMEYCNGTTWVANSNGSGMPTGCANFDVAVYYNGAWVCSSTIPISASGGTVTDVGGYRIHTFTSDGTFALSYLPVGKSIEYLVVAGGGGGGGATTGSMVGNGAGGGGGGVLTGTASGLAQGNYAIVVGAGGAGGGASGTPANGNNSSFNGLVAIGGGAGGSYNGAIVNGNSGGSGGGGGYGSTVASSGTAGQGNAGGLYYGGASYYGSGGGGGASGAGANGTGSGGGNGGAGLSSSISGSAVVYGSGGGGGSYNGVAGSGGSGAGSGTTNSTTAGSGVANRGGGGGGGGNAGNQTSSGGGGGSGIVVIRYLL